MEIRRIPVDVVLRFALPVTADYKPSPPSEIIIRIDNKYLGELRALDSAQVFTGATSLPHVRVLRHQRQHIEVSLNGIILPFNGCDHVSLFYLHPDKDQRRYDAEHTQNLKPIVQL